MSWVTVENKTAGCGQRLIQEPGNTTVHGYPRVTLSHFFRAQYELNVETRLHLLCYLTVCRTMCSAMPGFLGTQAEAGDLPHPYTCKHHRSKPAQEAQCAKSSFPKVQKHHL